MTDKIHVKMIRAPFNYYFSMARVAVVRELGPCLLDPEIAEAALRRGYAVPFDPRAASDEPLPESPDELLLDIDDEDELS